MNLPKYKIEQKIYRMPRKLKKELKKSEMYDVLKICMELKKNLLKYKVKVK